MSKTIFYQSSLPRAGSTLLQNIMGQNPLIYATPSSPMIDLIFFARIGYNKNIELKSIEKEVWKEGFYNFCRGGLQEYVNTLTDKPYILDKNRAWGSYYNLIDKIYPNPKILFMVRDLRAIFASMEKKFRQNPDYDDGLLNNETLENITTFQRVQTWANTIPIGYALKKLEQSILDKTANNFLFIKYEDLCTNPDYQLKRIYNYLDLEYFEHNFNHIPQITTEDDTAHGIYGDHIIRNTLEMLPQDYEEVLGKSTCDWIYDNYKDYFEIFNYTK